MNTGYFWRPLTDGWKLPEIVLAAEFNPISMIGIGNVEIQNGLPYIGGFLQYKTTTIDCHFNSFVWRYFWDEYFSMFKKKKAQI